MLHRQIDFISELKTICLFKGGGVVNCPWATLYKGSDRKQYAAQITIGIDVEAECLDVGFYFGKAIFLMTCIDSSEVLLPPLTPEQWVWRAELLALIGYEGELLALQKEKEKVRSLGFSESYVKLNGVGTRFPYSTSKSNGGNN